MTTEKKNLASFFKKLLSPFRLIWRKLTERHDVRVEKRVRREIEVNLSHELKTPLTCILAYSEILADTLDNPEQRESALVIYHKSKELVRLIENTIEISVLDFNPQSIYISEVNLSNILISTISKFKNYQEDENNYEINSEIELNIKLPGNEKYLSQMVFELIYNSYLYRKPDEKAVIGIKLSRSQDYAILKVQDNGIGIKSKFKDKVFMRFFRGDGGDRAQTSGMGIGLTLTKQIVEDILHGSIRLDSKEKQGTTIEIRLPLRANHAGEKS